MANYKIRENEIKFINNTQYKIFNAWTKTMECDQKNVILKCIILKFKKIHRSILSF